MEANNIYIYLIDKFKDISFFLVLSPAHFPVHIYVSVLFNILISIQDMALIYNYGKMFNCVYPPQDTFFFSFQKWLYIHWIFIMKFPNVL
jgi:hypothetical protein